ncbi:MAG: hypothetical protein FWE90_08130 [Defluviitaleaceae bacterium]|nr:hypothetical protein [Defluviitaleaceae bacterium]
MGWMETLDKTLDHAEGTIIGFIDNPIAAAKATVKGAIYLSIHGVVLGLKGLFGIGSTKEEEHDRAMGRQEPVKAGKAVEKDPDINEQLAEAIRKRDELIKKYQKFIENTLKREEAYHKNLKANEPQPQVSKAPQQVQPQPSAPPLPYSQEKANAPLPPIPPQAPQQEAKQPLPYSQEKANAPLPPIPPQAPQQEAKQPLPYSQEKANAPLPPIPPKAPQYSQEKANAPLPPIPQSKAMDGKPLPEIPQSKAKDGKPLPEIPGRQPMSAKDLDDVVKKSDVKPLNLPSWQNKDKVPLNKDGKPMTLSERLNLPGRNTYNSKKSAPPELKKDEPAKEKAPMLPKKKV